MKPPVFWYRAEDVNCVIGSVFTNNGSVTFPSGYFKNSAYFNGGNYLSSANVVPLSMFTVEFWLYDTAPSNGARVYIGTAYTGPGFFQFRENSGALYLGIVNQAGQFYAIYTGEVMLSSYRNAWHHWAVTLDGTNMQVYLDGSSIYGPFSAPGPYAFSGTHLDIGSERTAGIPMTGYIDNVKIYDYIKTDFSDRFNERGGMNDTIISI